VAEALFKIIIRRDKKGDGVLDLLREQEIVIPIELRDGGFSIEIHHLGHVSYEDKEPMKLQGYIGPEVISTTVEFKGSPRIKRTTPRLRK
jgi:hypothetical protein